MRDILFFQLLGCISHLWGSLLGLNLTPGHNYRLECLNDYQFTIRCELNMTSEPGPHGALYWLEFYDEREPFECMLTSQTYPWVCVVNLYGPTNNYPFTDTDIFQISLNYSFHGNNGSAVLDKGYKPVNYIRPVPPLNLRSEQKPDKVVFHWSSGYHARVLPGLKLKYQLRIHGKGEVPILSSGYCWFRLELRKGNSNFLLKMVLDVQALETNMSVPISKLAPSTSYKAHVRSEPDQGHYKGVWSHWGPTIYWTTGPANTENSTGPEADIPNMSFVTVCLALFLVPAILICYFVYTRWKRCVLNPSPVPHIGDFKCSTMQPKNVSDLLLREESLHINSLTEEFDSAPQPNPTQYENVSNVNDGSGHTSCAGSPQSPSMLQSSVGSKVSMNSWMQVLMSAENGSVTYSDDYCTLSLSEHAVNTHKN